MDDHSVPDAPTPIKLESLSTTGAISALGLVAARTLQQHGIVVLMVSTDGAIEVVPVEELLLDEMSTDSALSVCVNRGYTDQQMQDYLRQRDVRLARTAQSSPQDDHR